MIIRTMDNTCQQWINSLLITIVFVSILPGEMKARRISRRTPFFHETEKNVTVFSGDSATLRCTIENLGTKMVSWRKLSSNVPLTVGKMVFTETDGIDLKYDYLSRRISRWNLVLKRVEMRHAGLYECQINTMTVHKYTVRLTVIDTDADHPPGIILKGTDFVNLYQSINLTCIVTGSEQAPDNIDWFHNGHKIKPGDSKWKGRIQILRFKRGRSSRSLISQLLIDFSRQSDKGGYVCRSPIATTKIEVHVLNSDTDIKSREIDGRNPSISGSRRSVPENRSTFLHYDSLAVLFTIVVLYVNG